MGGARAQRVSGTLTSAALAGGAGHACVVPVGATPSVAWSALRNPVVSDPAAGVKDQAVVWFAGAWHMLFSEVTDAPTSPGGVHWNVATATSPDLLHWSAPTPWPAQPGVVGAASPDLVREADGRFVATYQSDPGNSSGVAARLYFRTSTDLRTWSAPEPLAQNLAPEPGDRMIDGALVDTGHLLLLGFKFSSSGGRQVFELARSTSGTLRGPWVLVGRPDISVYGDTVENYEFVHLDGAWRLLATSNTLDQPWLFTLAGEVNSPRGWLDWSGGRELAVPSEAFNSGSGVTGADYEHANSAYLCDVSSSGAHEFYLYYAGSTELTAFGGWGHARIGVARSTDLEHWQVPPG